MDILDDNVIINKSYFSEDSEMIFKGPDKVKLMQKNMMISTMVNEARKAGFYLETILEEENLLQDDINGYVSRFWKRKRQNVVLVR